MSATKVTRFEAHYSESWGDSAWCGVPAKLHGYEPSDGKRHPVFIYTVGTFGQYDAAEGDLMAQEMAKRGFVAVSAQYQNFLNGSCDVALNKTRCIYDPWSGISAVSVLCARGSADCSKGIVVGGMSQGAQVAIMAKNFDWRVNAAWAMGGTDVSQTMAACVDASWTRALPSNRLRVVNGEHDVFANQLTAELLTSSWCPWGAQSCLREDGSGWYMVRDSQVQDGTADHCYYTTNGGCTNTPTFDPSWAPPARNPWSLNTSLDWLARYASR